MYFSLSPGKVRGLQQISGETGVFTMAAMDHRGSLEKSICPLPDADCYRAMVEFKLELCSALAPHASAVLLDPVYGAAQAIAEGEIPRETGLLVSIEETGYEGNATARVSRLLEGWGVEKIRRLGASAVKMLVYFRPDSGALARAQLETVAKVADDCVKYDIPFLVEPVSYPLEGENSDDLATRKTEIVVETAKMMTALPIDVLKAEFPADMSLVKDDPSLLDACRALDAASTKPWVILSAGADYPVFRRQVELACRAGASGFLAGRAIWQEAVDMTDQTERKHFLEELAVERIKEISAAANQTGRPWYAKLGIPADRLIEISPEWYLNY